MPSLSWAGPTVWRRELRGYVVDGVRDVGAGDAVGAELSVQECDPVPQLTVFVVEFANAFVGECEALPQRGVGCTLDSRRCRLGRLRYGGQSAELAAQFGLGVEPRAGDAGTRGDLHDGAPLAGFVELLQGLAGTFEGVGATALGSGDEGWLLSRRI